MRERRRERYKGRSRELRSRQSSPLVRANKLGARRFTYILHLVCAFNQRTARKLLTNNARNFSPSCLLERRLAECT